MDVGIQMVFASYGWSDISDAQVWNEEIRLARLADELGFDVLWSVEHHFHDYSFCPDNLQLMSYLAGVTSHADLGTAAVILPWHDPLRVAEQVAILDHVSNSATGGSASASDAACRAASSPPSAGRSRWTNRASGLTKPRR
jgi:hypothetical protein